MVAVWWVVSFSAPDLNRFGAGMIFFFLPTIHLALVGIWIYVVFKTYSGE